MSEMLATDTAVDVEGIGSLDWSVVGRNYSRVLLTSIDGRSLQEWSGNVDHSLSTGATQVHEIYGTPDEHGFSLTLVLNTPFRGTGREVYTSLADPIDSALEHAAYDDQGNDAETHFPKWFLQFLGDLQERTGAEQISCYDDGPENGQQHNVITIDAVYDVLHERTAPRIADAGVLLGSLAVHLSGLKSSSK